MNRVKVEYSTKKTRRPCFRRYWGKGKRVERRKKAGGERRRALFESFRYRGGYHRRPLQAQCRGGTTVYPVQKEERRALAGSLSSWKEKDNDFVRCRLSEVNAPWSLSLPSLLAEAACLSRKKLPGILKRRLKFGILRSHDLENRRISAVVISNWKG